jgi:hypothetical protein
VGELAKLMHPGGAEITSPTHEEQVAETRALLTRDEVTIFEAAICHGDLFARVDVLQKRSDRVEIVEVKAKRSSPALRSRTRWIRVEAQPDSLACHDSKCPLGRE